MARVQCRLARLLRRGACTASIDSMNKELAAVFGGALQPDVARAHAPPGLANAANAAPELGTAAGPPAALTHVDSEGRLRMVDVGSKPHTRRTASASARVLLGREAFQQVAENRLKKGDVLVVAQLAGVGGAKLTSQLIPLCHSLNLSWVNVRLSLDHQNEAVYIRADAETVGPTGVEMEALTAAAVAGLTVYDMVKGVTKAARLTDVQLEAKAGGRSGTYSREDSPQS